MITLGLAYGLERAETDMLLLLAGMLNWGKVFCGIIAMATASSANRLENLLLCLVQKLSA